MRTFFILYVSIIISISFTSTIPLPDNADLSYHESNTPTNRNQQPPTPKQHLFMFVIESFTKLTTFYADNAANITKNILADDTLNENSENLILQDFKKNLTEFFYKYKRISELVDTMELVELYSNLTSDYYGLKEEELNKESKIIVNILRKYGSEKLENDFHTKHGEFVKEFCKEFEKVKVFLEKELLDWFEEFKEITDMNQRTEAFGNFLMFYV
ncbi:uncharacterized protein ACRADG_005026 [Cochliomyia hominivorax]